MNVKFSMTVHALITISFLSTALNQASPAIAENCRSAQTFGSIDFGDCKSTNFVGSSSFSIEKYKIRQAAQFDVAIADYSNNFNANIAQLGVKSTITTWKLKTGELELYSLALERSSNITSTNSQVAVLATNQE